MKSAWSMIIIHYNTYRAQSNVCNFFTTISSYIIDIIELVNLFYNSIQIPLLSSLIQKYHVKNI